MEQRAWIELTDVTKVFGDRPEAALRMLREGADKEQVREKTGQNVGVNHVSLKINKGELFVIMGLSGSGKSTLLRCLNRLIEPTTGTIVIDGTDITRLNKAELLRFRQKKMAMVFQQFALFPHRTVLENVAFGLEVQNVARERRLAIAEEKLELVGLKGWGHQFPQNLSGGMQQRVGLARALANDPDILLMDEAFSALDPLIRDDMQNELLNLQQQLHKTIVFITHDLNEALKIGDRIALMKDGEVVQVGTPEDIVSHPANEYVARFVKGVDVTKVLTAEDVMKRPTPLVRVKDGPRVALRTLRDAGLSSGFVVDEGRRLRGLVTADELAAAVKAKRTSVADCTLESTVTVSPQANLEELVSRIVESRYPLAVVDEDGVLRGLVLKSSILEAMAGQGGEADVAETPAGVVD
ncbi:MAG: glycine betaine/L-proline ABC transporter ATP-binding protein [Alicyclobacillus herbarius]|uniref:quaternary amine ABC transporter ATP-binding protein n=1 Tax=Alicyclobacillus herbarius TaxID=122960 RepID=UPI0023539F0E|nr:glycine betaine/L-proline ABC transporter ATP-binding protein [Alicyclobacillus herbarius]MCL6633738.1 glycine betaine/L-proline ABC transporter ATP-binding protein [Alicyclobacillus herbarius]